MNNFKRVFVFVCVFLLGIYGVLFPYLWGYEDGTNTSKKVLLSAEIFDKIFFSYDFWAKSPLVSFCLLLSFLTSGVVGTFFCPPFALDFDELKKNFHKGNG